MSGYVRVPRKTLRAVLDEMAGLQILSRAAEDLRQSLRPRPSRPARKERLKKKATKRADKNAETAAIREAVVFRAGGSCEGCGAAFGTALAGPGEMDHQLGRGKVAQSVRNCWLICRLCHVAKTNNAPSAAYWLERMLRHARTHGYVGQAAVFANRLNSIRDIQAASEVSRGG